ncbi:MAG: CRISPR-associated endoribonuclease Cas6 [candidate division WOR-3 bacterium]
MRLKLLVGEDKEYKIPWSYNYFLASSIYYLLSKYSLKFSYNIHSKGWSYKNKNFKLFSFSPLFPQKISFEKDYILMIGPLTFILSSPDSVFIEILESVLKKEGFLKLLCYNLPVLKTKIFEISEINNELKAKTLSPLVVSQSKKEGNKSFSIYLSPETEHFYHKLKEIIKDKFECFTGERLSDYDIEIMCESYKSKLYSIKNIKVKGYMATLNLRGNIQVLRFIMDSGLGEKTSMGFGMVEKTS